MSCPGLIRPKPEKGVFYMKAVLKRELKNYLKNPILWVGILIVFVGIYQSAGAYLKLHYIHSEEELEELEEPDVITDADILNGYVPSDRSQQMELGYQEIERLLESEEGFGYTKAQAEKIVSELRAKDMTIQEIDEYLEKEYCFYNATYIFEDFSQHKGMREEVNGYIEEKLKEHPFSWYFARKFADFCGLYTGFFSAVLLAFLYIRDTRRDTWELLHTKPITALSYVGGKVLGGLFAMLIVLGVMNLIFGGLCMARGVKAGFPVRIWDLPAASVKYIVPNILVIVCIYTIIAFLFRNPLPAVPFIFLYMLYSNMGAPGAASGYAGRAFAVMVRFPGNFFDAAEPPMAAGNQIFLLMLSAVLFALAVRIWKRRRV